MGEEVNGSECISHGNCEHEPMLGTCKHGLV